MLATGKHHDQRSVRTAMICSVNRMYFSHAIFRSYCRLRPDSPYAKMFDPAFQAKVLEEHRADSVAAAEAKARAEAELALEVSRLELASGEHAEPPIPKANSQIRSVLIKFSGVRRRRQPNQRFWPLPRLSLLRLVQ
jgi:hypothetical protein